MCSMEYIHRNKEKLVINTVVSYTKTFYWHPCARKKPDKAGKRMLVKETGRHTDASRWCQLGMNSL